MNGTLKSRSPGLTVVVITAVLLPFAMAILPGCGGGGGGSRGVVVVPNQITTPVSMSRISGSVTDTDGNPVVGVQVSMLQDSSATRGATSVSTDSTVETDAIGLFSIDLPATPSEDDRIILKLSRAGFVDKHAVFRVRRESVNEGMMFLPIKIVSMPGDEASATNAEITRTDGTVQIVSPQTVTDSTSGLAVVKTIVDISEDVQEIKFALPSPADTTVNSVEFTIGGTVSGGRTAAMTLGSSGEISCALFYGDPTDTDALETFPGEFITSDDTGSTSAGRAADLAASSEGVLITGGFVQIKLEDSDGSIVESFSDGAEVGVTMRVPDGVFNPETGGAVAEGDSVPIFTYDEATNEWKVEHNADGSVKRGTVMSDSDGLYVPFTTNHLSWFNLDWKSESCGRDKPEIRAIDQDGNSVMEFSLKSIGEQFSFNKTFTTNDGVISFWRAPADPSVDWSIQVYTNTQRSAVVPVNSCDNFTVNLTEVQYEQKEISSFCNGTPYPDVQVILFDSLDGVFIEGGKTGSDGTMLLDFPVGENFRIFGYPTDQCKSSSATATDATDGGLEFNFSNSCCRDLLDIIRIDELVPALARGLDPTASVSGTTGFSGGASATSIPDIQITLVEGRTTILDRVDASNLGAVSWGTAQGGFAESLALTIANPEHLSAGKTYSFTIHLDTSQIMSSDGTPLEMAGYLMSVPGIVSYSASSITGVFTTEAGAANQLPVPNAGEEKLSTTGTPTTLDGSLSYDPDQDPLDYSWKLVSGADTEITGSNSAIASFTPAEAGDYIFTLTVDDGRGGTVRDMVTISVCASIDCSADTDCDDGSEYTVDACVGAGTCEAACENEGTHCSITLDKVNYEPGEQMGIIITSSNSGSEALECGAEILLKRDSETVVWFSFDDDEYITVQPGTRVSETIYITVQEEWAETDSPSGSNYGIYPVRRDGSEWDQGDNFNIIIRKCDEAECSSDTDCDDGVSYTIDTCSSPGTCSSECNNDCTAACLNDSDCDDGDDFTDDECVDFFACDPETACTHTQVACRNNNDCDDGVVASVDICTDANTKKAACVNTNRGRVIGSGDSHSCRLLDSGSVECWGTGLGIGQASVSDSPAPLEVSGISDAISLSVGDNSYSCVALSGGTVQCWGDNSCGQLGDGTTTESPTPVNVSGIADAISVSAGSFHTCALLSDETIKCWGCNNTGTLGDGTTTDSYVPVTVQGISDAIMVSAGEYHTCAVLSTGRIKCWGANTYGALGDGTSNDSTVPVEVFSISNAVIVASGDYHSCAALSSGYIKCWGWNFRGQLGGLQEQEDPENPVDYTYIPLFTDYIENGVSVFAGFLTTCAVLSDGAAQCWGYNANGQVGNGETGPTLGVTKPVDVVGVSDATGISIGKYHSCAMLSYDNAMCWGANNSGQLGNGTTTDSYTPIYVSECTLDENCDDGNPLTVGTCISGGSPDAYCSFDLCDLTCSTDNDCDDSDDSTIDMCLNPGICISECVNNPAAVEVVAGDYMACVKDTENSVNCWGQIDGSNKYPTPISVANDATTLKISYQEACIVDSSGSVKCWGTRTTYTLGDGSTTQSATPVTVSGISNATDVSPNYSLILNTDGSVNTWGWNGWAQLGNGTVNGYSTTPVVSLVDNVTKINNGKYFACVLISDGTVECWGNNQYKQLGYTASVYSMEPDPVTGLTGVSDIASGENHTCALMSDNSVKCWGQNAQGQLGDGTTTNSLAPVAVSGITDAVSIYSGQYNSCVILSGGNIKCWGQNAQGQLGDGTTANSSTPIEITGVSDAISIAMGRIHLCALLSSGGITCWGDNSYGALGDGTTDNSLIPVDVTGITNAVSIAVGEVFSCAVLDTGNAKCWGRNYYNTLGDGTSDDSSTPVTVFGY